MNAMQKTSPSQHKDDAQITNILKVPKLKLKLSQPFQKHVESEQSSTESDSESDNDNDNEDDDNDTMMQMNMSNDPSTVDHHQPQQPQQTLPFSLAEQQQLEHYPYDANNTLEQINRFTENANESGSRQRICQPIPMRKCKVLMMNFQRITLYSMHHCHQNQLQCQPHK